MHEPYRSYVYVKRVTDLRFPAMCAYCNQPLAAEHRNLTSNILNVPHCAQHAKSVIIQEMVSADDKLRRINKSRTLILGAIFGAVAGLVSYSRDTLVFGNFGRSVNSFIIGLTVFVVATAFLYALELFLYQRVTPQTRDVSQAEEVISATTEAFKISKVYTGAYAGAYLVYFHSDKFASEFARLNSNLLFEKQDVPVETVHKPTIDTPRSEQVRQASTPHAETQQRTAKTTETSSPRATGSKRTQDIQGVQPTPPSSSTNTELIANLRKNLSLKVMYDEAKVDRLIDYERRLNPNANLVELMQAAIDRWEHDNR